MKETRSRISGTGRMTSSCGTGLQVKYVDEDDES